MKVAYKLFRVKKDNTITSLFINKTKPIKLNTWLRSKNYPTKGFKIRPGWHSVNEPNAPHLSLTNRAWHKILIKDFKEEKRPKHQGGKWFLSKYIKVIERI